MNGSIRTYTWTLVVLISASLTGCFGAGTVAGSTRSWDVNNPGESGLCPSNYEKMIVACPIKPHPKARSVEDITPTRLIDLWGIPQSEQLKAGLRTLTYRHGLAWRGITVFVIVPVPLLIPLGYNDAKFSFQNDHLVHVEYTENQLDAAICGLHSEGPDGIGCIAHWH